MKNFYLAALLVSMCFSASAQEYKARAPKAIETRRVAGVQNYIQDEFQRANKPVVLETNLQPVFTITSTNIYEGLYFVAPTNAALSAAFTVSLPNPTNHINRVFRFITCGNSQIVLSNNWGTGSANGFRELVSYGVSNVVWLVTSNKLATCYSTGTNYLVRVE